MAKIVMILSHDFAEDIQALQDKAGVKNMDVTHCELEDDGDPSDATLYVVCEMTDEDAEKMTKMAECNLVE